MGRNSIFQSVAHRGASAQHEIRRVLMVGVQEITTNRPDKLKKVLQGVI